MYISTRKQGESGRCSPRLEALAVYWNLSYIICHVAGKEVCYLICYCGCISYQRVYSWDFGMQYGRSITHFRNIGTLIWTSSINMPKIQSTSSTTSCNKIGFKTISPYPPIMGYRGYSGRQENYVMGPRDEHICTQMGNETLSLGHSVQKLHFLKARLRMIVEKDTKMGPLQHKSIWGDKGAVCNVEHSTLWKSQPPQKKLTGKLSLPCSRFAWKTGAQLWFPWRPGQWCNSTLCSPAYGWRNVERKAQDWSALQTAGPVLFDIFNYLPSSSWFRSLDRSFHWCRNIP